MKAAPTVLRIFARWKAAGHISTPQTAAVVREAMFTKSERKKATLPPQHRRLIE